ncbi:hypothetical protein [Ekhidna sp.]
MEHRYRDMVFNLKSQEMYGIDESRKTRDLQDINDQIPRIDSNQECHP